MIKKLEELWWSQWMRQVFPSLVPFRKWKSEHRNPCVGDVVLVQYSSKVGKGDFRLARIAEVHPDRHGAVRTITVKMRPRDAREKVLDDPPYLHPKPPILLRLGVQRVCVLLPVEEQEGSSPASSATTCTRVESEETVEKPLGEPEEEHADVQAVALDNHHPVLPLGDREPGACDDQPHGTKASAPTHDESVICNDQPPGTIASALSDDEDFIGFTSEEANEARKNRRQLQDLVNI